MDGTPFGRYRLIELLGRGGMGEVWRAYDTAIDRVVALKVLPDNFANDQVFQERFRREAKAAAGLDEPHVVPIHEFGDIDGRLFVTMRFIKGRDLQDLLRDGPLPPVRAVAIVEQIASALHAAHEVGLVHRDVKPSNILVAKNDFAYLIDFGIARAAGETALTSTGTAIGTWAYMAPERLNTGQADARSDTYALACVLHEALTGRRPYPGDSLEQQIVGHLTTPPPRPSVIRRGVPAALDGVIATGMAKEPAHRYASTLKLAEHARSVITPPVPSPVYGQPSSPGRPPSTAGAPPQAAHIGPPVRNVSNFYGPPPVPRPPLPPPPHVSASGAGARSPEEKLASWNWKLLNSWWILPSILSCGFLGWVGFLVAGIRTGKPKYWVFCAIYGAAFVLFGVIVNVAPKESLVYDLSAIPLFVAWLAPAVHAAILNREYLRTLAYKKR